MSNWSRISQPILQVLRHRLFSLHLATLWHRKKADALATRSSYQRPPCRFCLGSLRYFCHRLNFCSLSCKICVYSAGRVLLSRAHMALKLQLMNARSCSHFQAVGLLYCNHFQMCTTRAYTGPKCQVWSKLTKIMKLNHLCCLWTG